MWPISRQLLLAMACLTVTYVKGEAATPDCKRKEAPRPGSRVPHTDPKKFLDDLFKSGYSALNPPKTTGDVDIALFITSIDEITESTFVLDAQMYVAWTDRRTASKTGGAKRHLSSILTGSKVASEVWVPPMYFQNARFSRNPAVLLPNQILYAYSNGNMEFLARVILTVSCIQQLQSFPFDAQTCELVILSMADDANGRPQWNKTRGATTVTVTSPGDHLRSSPDGAVHLAESQISQAEYTITSWEGFSITQIKGIGAEPYNKTALVMRMSMKRKWTQYVSRAYLPTVLLVGISWMSFNVDQTAVPARVTLTITTVLTMQTVATNVEATLPKVSYWKSLDAWFTVAQIFVFGALIEFVFTHGMASKDEEKGLERARAVDRKVALVFLPLFIVFCVAYFFVMATRAA